MAAASNPILQNVFYHYVLGNQVLAEKFNPEFFSSKILQGAFRLARDYVLKYRQAPSLAQMKELVLMNNMQDEITDDLLDILYSQAQMVSNYSEDWLYDEVTNYAQYQQIKKSVVDVAAYLKLATEDLEGGHAKEIVEHAKAMFNKSCVLDFDEDMTGGGSDVFDAEAHKPKRMVRSSSGYPFIDMCLKGGYFIGSLIVFAGPPKIGKSLWLQNLCAKSVEMGENSCYVSFELPEEMVVSRIGSNLFSIDSMTYESFADDTIAMRDKIAQYRKSRLIKPGTLIVKDFPTSQVSTLELQAWLLEKEEALSTEGHPFKFKNIFVDYLNIMRDHLGRGGSDENLYLKVKHIAENLRAMAKMGNWTVISATQTTKDSYESSDITTSQISESSGLGATVEAMFAIISDPLMKAQGKYYLKCLFDRVSPQEGKKKLYNCDFKYLRISEDTTEGVIDTALVNPIITQQKFIKGAVEMRKAKQQQQSFQPGALDRPNTEAPSPYTQQTNLLDVQTDPTPNSFSSPLFNVKGAGLFDSKPQQ